MGILGVAGCWVTANGRATCTAVQSKTTKKRSREAAQCIMGGPLPGDNFDSRFSVLNIFLLNWMEISVKPVSYSEFFLQWAFRKLTFYCVRVL